MLFKLGERRLEGHLMMVLKSMGYMDMEVNGQLLTLPFREKSQPRRAAAWWVWGKLWNIPSLCSKYIGKNHTGKLWKMGQSNNIFVFEVFFFFFCLQAHVKLIYSLIHSTHKTLLRFYISFYFFCSPCFPLSCSLFQLNTTFLWSTYVANYISNTSNALFLTPF